MEALERGRFWQLHVPTLLQRTSWMQWLFKKRGRNTEMPGLSKNSKTATVTVCHLILSVPRTMATARFKINEHILACILM